MARVSVKGQEVTERGRAMRRRIIAAVIATSALLGIGGAATAVASGHVVAASPRTHYYG